MATNPNHQKTLGGHFMRQKVLEAASRVFARRGIVGATVEHLLQGAGIARRTFYRYFANKEAVLAGLYDLACAVLLDSIRRAVAETDGVVAKAVAGIDVYLSFHASQPDLVSLLAAEAMRAESPLAPRRQEVHRELLALFAEEMSGPQERPLDPLVYRSLLWMLESMSIHTLTETPGKPADLARARGVMVAIAGRLLAPKETLAAVELPTAPPTQPKEGSR